MTKRAVLLKALASMPSDVSRLFNGIDPTEARRRPMPGRWSATDILHHLCETETGYLAQLQDVVYKERPALPALRVKDPDPELGAGLDMPVGELIDRFKQARAETQDFLAGLSPGDWQRKAAHETLGQTSLRFLVQYLVDHDTQYLGQLLAARRGVDTPLTVPQSLPDKDKITTLDNEEKHERKRTRKWPRRQRRRD